MLLPRCPVKLESTKKRDRYIIFLKHFTAACKCKSSRKALYAAERRMELVARIQKGRKAVSVLRTIGIVCTPPMPRHTMVLSVQIPHVPQGMMSPREAQDSQAETTSTPSNRAVPHPGRARVVVRS